MINRSAKLSTIVAASAVLCMAGASQAHGGNAPGGTRDLHSAARNTYESGYDLCDNDEIALLRTNTVGNKVRVRWGPTGNTPYAHQKTVTIHSSRYYTVVSVPMRGYHKVKWDVRVRGENLDGSGPDMEYATTGCVPAER